MRVAAELYIYTNREIILHDVFVQLQSIFNSTNINHGQSYPIFGFWLKFVIDFKLSLDQKQDFLFFEGVNDSAHLFRQNSTILLNVNNELHKTDIVDRIQFSWRGFKVNGSEMEKIKSTGEEKILTFDAFTFLSPIVKISKEEEEAKEEYFHSFLSQKINYYYIFAIVFLTVLLVDAKPRTFRLVKDLFSRMNESEYEVMQLKQSTV